MRRAPKPPTVRGGPGAGWVLAGCWVARGARGGVCRWRGLGLAATPSSFLPFTAPLLALRSAAELRNREALQQRGPGATQLCRRERGGCRSPAELRRRRRSCAGGAACVCSARTAARGAPSISHQKAVGRGSRAADVRWGSRRSGLKVPPRAGRLSSGGLQAQRRLNERPQRCLVNQSIAFQVHGEPAEVSWDCFSVSTRALDVPRPPGPDFPAQAIDAYQVEDYKLSASMNALNVAQSVVIYAGMASGLLVCTQVCSTAPPLRAPRPTPAACPSRLPPPCRARRGPLLGGVALFAARIAPPPPPPTTTHHHHPPSGLLQPQP